jgi:lipid-A-disaccharide synthase
MVRDRHPSLRIAVACYNDEHAAMVRQQADRLGMDVDVRAGQTRELIRSAFACIACSGSVSLQLLAERKPTVVYFQITRLQWIIKQLLMRVKYITLVNLLSTNDIRRRDFGTYDPDAGDAERVPMPEYLTTAPCPDKLAAHVLRWIDDPNSRTEVVDALDSIARRVAHPGATRRAVDFILRMLDTEFSVRKAA